MNAKRKGIRHPQRSKAASGSIYSKTATIKHPVIRPKAVLAGTALTSNPLFFGGAYSAINDAAPAYSPDAEKPCTRRHISNNAGAHKPICA
jgi:hypothetical protein